MHFADDVCFKGSYAIDSEQKKTNSQLSVLGAYLKFQKSQI